MTRETVQGVVNLPGDYRLMGQLMKDHHRRLEDREESIPIHLRRALGPAMTRTRCRWHKAGFRCRGRWSVLLECPAQEGHCSALRPEWQGITGRALVFGRCCEEECRKDPPSVAPKLCNRVDGTAQMA